jgi:carboxypeptidase family protein
LPPSLSHHQLRLLQIPAPPRPPPSSGGDLFKEKKIQNGGNPIISVRFDSVQTTGMRMMITHVTYTDSQSIRELEAWNNPAGTLTGTVTDPAGKPVAGAFVRAGDDQTITNAAGKYTLVTDAGSDTVVAGEPGSFHDRTAHGIVVAANSTVTHDFMLVPVPTNLALTATADASSEYSGGGYEASKANDGDVTTRWNSDSGDTVGAYLDLVWLARGDTNQWVALTWDKPTHFTALQLRGFQNNIERSVLQILATDGTTWMDLPNTVFVPYGSPKPDFLFPDGWTTTGLRLSMSATDTAGVPPGVSEILVFDAPLPKPAQ